MCARSPNWMTWRRVCASESSSHFPSWINWLNKNPYLLLCLILLINYKYYHYCIPSHNRIISKFFWVITVESTYIRWEPSHEPIVHGSEHKSETTLGWMPEHKTGWWMVQKRFYKASLSWSRKTEQESLRMFNYRHFFRCPASRHPRGVQVNVRGTAHPPDKYSLCSDLRMKFNFLLMTHHIPKSTQTSELQYASSEKMYTAQFIWPWIFT